MSHFFVSYLEISFPCEKSVYDKIAEAFDAEHMDSGLMDLVIDWSEEDQAGIVSTLDSEVFSDFDEQLVELNSLCQTFGTHISGYYVCDTDCNDVVRVDVMGDKIEAEMFASYGTNWLLDYTVEQMMTIHEKAKEMFPRQPIDRSDSYEGD